MTELKQDPTAPALRSACGIADFGKRVIVWGKDLHEECMEMSFVHYYLFCATGRWFDEKRARVFEQLWISTGYPDGRLWCNRIAGYLGSARVDPGLAISAALAASNSTVYGLGALNSAYGLQCEIPENLRARETWLEAQIAKNRILPGYGRPVPFQDERVAIVYRTLARHHIQAGPALRRAYWVGKRLTAEKGVELNVAGTWAAVAIDFNMSRDEFEAFMVLMLAPGYIAVYTDQHRRKPLTFLSGYQSSGSTNSTNGS